MRRPNGQSNEGCVVYLLSCRGTAVLPPARPCSATYYTVPSRILYHSARSSVARIGTADRPAAVLTAVVLWLCIGVQAHDCQLNDSDREDLGDWCALLSSLSRAPARLRRAAVLPLSRNARQRQWQNATWSDGLRSRGEHAMRRERINRTRATQHSYDSAGAVALWHGERRTRLCSDARWWGMEFYLRLPDGTAAADERKANGDADGGLALDAEVSL